MKPPGTNAGSGSISRLGSHFADRRSRIPRPSLFNVSKAQNSNRESRRRVRADDSARRNDEVTAVTQRKERVQFSSNRELEACFSPPVGEGVYLPPGLGLGVGWDLGGLRGASDSQNSNRECQRLETAVTRTKQRTPTSSNREIEAYFSPSKFERAPRPRRHCRGAGSPRPRFGTGCWFGPFGETHTGGLAANAKPNRAGSEPRSLRRIAARYSHPAKSPPLSREKDRENEFTFPQILLRLNRGPIVCFV